VRVTNKKQLPGPLVRAIEKVVNQYNAGDSFITATGLIEPARIGALKAIHRDEMSEDALDLLYSVQGTSMHTIMETAGRELEDEGYIVEKRYYTEVMGKLISAQIDLFHQGQGLLQDYKITSVYSVRDGAKEEYVKQLNIGAYILRQNGFEVKQLQIVAILRDWSKLERAREVADCAAKGYTPRYPEHQVAVLDVPLVSDDEVLDYIKERLAAHIDARTSAPTALPECTEEERWAKPDVYAVTKKGQKKAYRLFESDAAAKMCIQAMDVKQRDEYVVVFRRGESTRCKSYCPVAKWCSQAKAMGITKDDE